jgi:hypothetical protein
MEKPSVPLKGELRLKTFFYFEEFSNNKNPERGN